MIVHRQPLAWAKKLQVQVPAIGATLPLSGYAQLNILLLT